MRFYYDFEFHERVINPFPFTRKYHTIEPIELGMVDDLGRELRVLYNDFDIKAAWNNKWLRTNVILKYYTSTVHGDWRNYINFDFKWFKRYIKQEGKSKKEVEGLIREYIFGYYNNEYNDGMSFSDVAIKYGVQQEHIELIGYYSAYDHVALATTFGTMMDLPEEFPMFTTDLQQEKERIAMLLTHYKNPFIITKPGTRFRERVEMLEQSEDYPKQSNEHSAVYDARFNKELYNFLSKL